MLNAKKYTDIRGNTAKLPKTNIFYGNGFSMYLFQIDLSELKQKILNGEYVLTTYTKHFLHLTNTVFDREMNRAVDFDLALYKIPEYWDEGVGNENDVELGVSNWQNRTTLNEWTSLIVTGETPYKTIHFNNGSEDLHTDITDYVNAILTGDYIDYGLCLCFPESYFYENKDIGESISFYTKNFDEFYQPYVETIFEDTITDNRDNFIAEQKNDLYLYVTKGTNYYDLDELPVVDILDGKYVPISGLTSLTTTKVKKGIYKVVFGISGFICDGKHFFYDRWSNLKINGENIPDIKQKFVPKSYFNDFDFNGTSNDDKYILQFSGIKINEKIIEGSVRKIKVNIRSIRNQKTDLLEEIYYRLHVKEGRTDVVVIDWSKMDKTNTNSVILDTAFLLPREYYLEIKAVINGTEIFYPSDIKFEIVSNNLTINNADETFVIVEESGFDYTFSFTLS
jgi:hypothetical protein